MSMNSMQMSCEPEDIIGMMSRGETSAKKLFSTHAFKSNSSSIVDIKLSKKTNQDEGNPSISLGEKE